LELSIKIGENNLGFTGMAHIVENSKKYNNLKKIYLINVQLNKEQSEHLAHTLKIANPNINALI